MVHNGAIIELRHSLGSAASDPFLNNSQNLLRAGHHAIYALSQFYLIECSVRDCY